MSWMCNSQAKYKIIMRSILLIVTVLCWINQSVVGFDEDFVVDEFGEVTTAHVNKASVKNQGIDVVFSNGLHNDSLELFWLSQDGEQVPMGEIEPSGTMNMHSFGAHVFTAKAKYSKGLELHPRVHTITLGKTSYSFGLPGADDVSAQVEKPFIRILNTKSTSVSAKFRNTIPTTIDVWFDDGRDGVPQGHLNFGQEYTVNAYEGHVFFFTEKGNKKKVLARHVVNENQVVYTIADPARPPPQNILDHNAREEAFMQHYYNRTGRLWRHYYGPNGPRPPPTLHMYPAQFVGQVHSVPISEPYWTCVGPKEQCHQSQSPFTLNLTVVSTAPKAFVVQNFLSPAEVDVIIQTAAPRMASSFVGNKDGGGARKSDTRTSRNAWVGREANGVTETLFRRAEQLLQIPHLDRHNTEDMQVVHYINGQKYDAHHDWGVSGYEESRFITLLLYLTDMAGPNAGGETSFPKGADGKGFKIHPGKGNAVLFYNLLEDGNGDDLALHAALPVHRGEKWLANFWVWDPRRR